MPSLEFEVYCGTCGAHCCNYTSVNGNKVTIECPDCFNEMESLRNEIMNLEEKVIDLENELKETL